MASYHTSFTYKEKNSFDEGYIIVAFEPDNGFKDTYLSMENVSDEYYDGTKRFDYNSKYNSQAEVQITIIKRDGTDMSVKDFRLCAKWLTGVRTNSWLDMYVGDTLIYSFLGKFLNLEQYKIDARTVGVRLTFSSLSPWAYSAPQVFDCSMVQSIYLNDESYETIDYEMVETEQTNQTISYKDSTNNWDTIRYATDIKLRDGYIHLIDSVQISLGDNSSNEVINYELIETECLNQAISDKDNAGSWDTVNYANNIDIQNGTISLVNPTKITLECSAPTVENAIKETAVKNGFSLSVVQDDGLWPSIQYADSVTISGDSLSLVNPTILQLNSNSTDDELETILRGKYVCTYIDAYYRIPSNASVIYYGPNTFMNAQFQINSGYKLSVVQVESFTVDTTILGKYIHTTYDNNYYYIPSDTTLTCSDSGTLIKASSAMKLSVKSTTSSTEGKVNTIILGKYIYTTYDNNYYYIPSDAKLTYSSTGTSIKASSVVRLTVQSTISTTEGSVLCRSKDNTSYFGLDGSVLTLNSLDVGNYFNINDAGIVYVDTSYNTQIDNKTDDLYTYIYLDIDYQNDTGDKFYVVNKTLNEESIVTDLSANENISISAKQFIISDKPKKVFGDSFNFVWPRLAPGINDLNIYCSGTGKAYFTYRYPMKVGDCAMDIDVYGNSINCGDCPDGGGADSGEIFTGTISWENITNTPHTIKGYGIDDAYTMKQVDDKIDNIELGDGTTIGDMKIDEKELNEMLDDVLG